MCILCIHILSTVLSLKIYSFCLDLSSEQRVGKFEDATYAMFVPTESDCSAVKKELIVLVSRILVQNVPCLRIFQDLVPSHIYHKFSKEVCQASEIVSFSTKML